MKLVWSELGRSLPFRPMRALTLPWSQAFNLVCEVALIINSRSWSLCASRITPPSELKVPGMPHFPQGSDAEGAGGGERELSYTSVLLLYPCFALVVFSMSFQSYLLNLLCYMFVLGRNFWRVIFIFFFFLFGNLFCNGEQWGAIGRQPHHPHHVCRCIWMFGLKMRWLVNVLNTIQILILWWYYDDPIFLFFNIYFNVNTNW